MITLDDLPEVGIISCSKDWYGLMNLLIFTGKYVTIWLLYVVEGVAWIFVDNGG